MFCHSAAALLSILSSAAVSQAALPEPPLLWTQSVGGYGYRPKTIRTGQKARGRVVVTVNKYDGGISYAAEASIHQYDTENGRPLMEPIVIGQNMESCAGKNMPEFMGDKRKYEAYQNEGFDDVFFNVVRDCDTGVKRIIAFDPVTGEARWEQEVKGLTSIVAPLDGDVLYASFGWGTTAYSASDGSVVWMDQDDDIANNPNTTSSGPFNMIMSADGSRVIGNSDTVRQPHIPVLFSREAASGAVLDTRYEKDGSSGGLAVSPDGNFLYLQNAAGVSKLFAMNLTSKPVWTWNNFTNIYPDTKANPAVSKDGAYVYAVSYSGGLAKINADTANREWIIKFDTGDEITTDSNTLALSPNDDFVYLQLRSGLYKINTETGEKEWLIPRDEIDSGNWVFDYSLSDDGNTVFTAHKNDIRAYSTWLPPTVAPTTVPTPGLATAVPTSSPTAAPTNTPSTTPTKNPTDPTSSGVLLSLVGTQFLVGGLIIFSVFL